MDIQFPFHFDNRGRTAASGADDHVREMLEQLVFTRPGERVNRPDFGSGILQLLFAPNSPELAATVQFTLQAAIQRWLGDIVELNDLNVDASDSTLTVEVKYLIRGNNQPQNATFTRTV